MQARLPFVTPSQLTIEVVYALRENKGRVPSSLVLEIPMSTVQTLGTSISYPTTPYLLGGLLKLKKGRVQQIYITVLECEDGLLELISEELKSKVYCRGTSKARFGSCYEVLLTKEDNEELQALRDSSFASYTAVYSR